MIIALEMYFSSDTVHILVKFDISATNRSIWYITFSLNSPS